MIAPALKGIMRETKTTISKEDLNSGRDINLSVIKEEAKRFVNAFKALWILSPEALQLDS